MRESNRIGVDALDATPDGMDGRWSGLHHSAITASSEQMMHNEKRG